MASRRSAWAYLIAALGSGGLVLSLWLPWYPFRIPDSVIQDAQQLSGQFGSFGPLIQQGAQLARALGTLHVNAWQVLDNLPVILVIAGVVAGGLAGLAASGRASGTSKVIVSAGAGRWC
jgi:hypothetical protein